MKPTGQTIRSVLAMLTALMLMLSLMPMSIAVAAEEISGVCGDDLTWKLEDNTLTISGTGDIYDYASYNQAPWFEYRLDIYILNIEEGVTGIGDNAFCHINRMKAAYLPKSLKSIGSRSFYDTDGNYYFWGGALDIAEDAFSGTRGYMHTLRGWQDVDKTRYSGVLTWLDGHIIVDGQSKQIYNINEEIKLEDICFSVYYAEDDQIPYSPERVTIGNYDNTSYGQKTVSVTVDGTDLDYIYTVTDGKTHIDIMEVTYEQIHYYTGSGIYPEPAVYSGSLKLTKEEDYTVSYKDAVSVGRATMTIRGIGRYEGYNKSFPYAILRRNIADTSTQVKIGTFNGFYSIPEVTAYYNGSYLYKAQYSSLFENNVNIGNNTAMAKIIGKEQYYGMKLVPFSVHRSATTINLQGAFNGNVEGELNEDYYMEEGMACPAKVTFKINSSMRHQAYYTLYRVDIDGYTEITSHETLYSSSSNTTFTYDFSFVYDEAVEEGGQIYMLSYSWVNSAYDVYSGVYFLMIPSKVSDATAMGIEQLADDGDFRRDYLAAYGEDGAVGKITWKVSDAAVATVKDGAVEFLKPGSVTVYASWNGLTASTELSATVQSLANADIISWNANDRKANVVYDGFLLKEGTDYRISVISEDSLTEVTFVGCGLFSGALIQRYDADGNLVEHTHSFTYSCSSTCNDCSYARVTDHILSDVWSKDQTHHWHTCVACGEKADSAEHIVSSDDQQCTVCGTLWIPGDLTGDYEVNNLDVEYLLWYTLFPEDYPLISDADFDDSGVVSNLDVEYLLWHTLYPEDYPL